MASQTNPSTISPLGILVVFLLIYALTLGVLTLFLFFGSRLAAAFFHVLSRRSTSVLSARSSYLFGSILAIGPVILLAMQSVAALSTVDVLLVLVFEVLAGFYVWRRI